MVDVRDLKSRPRGSWFESRYGYSITTFTERYQYFLIHYLGSKKRFAGPTNPKLTPVERVRKSAYLANRVGRAACIRLTKLAGQTSLLTKFATVVYLSCLYKFGYATTLTLVLGAKRLLTWLPVLKIASPAAFQLYVGKLFANGVLALSTHLLFIYLTLWLFLCSALYFVTLSS